MRNSIASKAAAILAAGLLVLPTTALAATSVTVGSDNYTEASSGPGWDWDGADNMGLNNYDGGSIAAEGNLILTLTGENTITSEPITIHEDWGDREVNIGLSMDGTITGEGSLTIKGDSSDGADSSFLGIASEDLTIDGAAVSVEASGDSATAINFTPVTSGTSKGLRIQNGSEVNIISDQDGILGGPGDPGIDAPVPEFIVKDSTLNIVAGNSPIVTWSTVTFDSSKIDLTALGHNNAIYAGGITLINEKGAVVEQVEGENFYTLVGPDGDKRVQLEPAVVKQAGTAAPAASGTSLPQTGDASTIATAITQALSAASGVLLGAGAMLKHRRER